MKIPIVFCFDNNFAKYAYVTISSLLSTADHGTVYKIYCIHSSDVLEDNLQSIKRLNEEYNCEIEFLKAEDNFNDAHQHRDITAASYYRLMLHKLLPHESKVIYADVDILFDGDLTDIYNLDLGSNIIAGVKNLYIHQIFEKNMKQIEYWPKIFGDSKNKYINAGFLIMNLNEIRKIGIWEEWLRLSKNKYEYHDQDILNMTCKDRILYLKPKYNSTYPIRAKGAENWNLFTKEELSEQPVIYHFTAAKPWNAKYIKQNRVWWEFIKNHTDLYPYFIKEYKNKQTILIRFKRQKKRFLNLFLKLRSQYT